MKKKIVAILALMFVLVGCGSDNELEEFTDTYNKRAISEDVSELIPEEFGEIEEIEDEKWQELYESDKYDIAAEYDGDNIISYLITIDPSTSFEEKEGEGYRASTLVARTLGLSVSDYVKNYEKALKTDIHSYSESGYKVRFSNLGWDSSIPISLSVYFTEE